MIGEAATLQASLGTSFGAFEALFGLVVRAYSELHADAERAFCLGHCPIGRAFVRHLDFSGTERSAYRRESTTPARPTGILFAERPDRPSWHCHPSPGCVES